MGDFHLPVAMPFSESAGGVGASSNGTVVTSGITNAFGAWTEFFSSTSKDTSAILLTVKGGSVSDEYTLNIAIGSAGNEEIIVEEFQFYVKSVANCTAVLLYCVVPKGSRVSVQVASSAASDQALVTLNLYAQSFTSPQSVSKYKAFGIVNTRGTVVDPGGTINTLGAWTELSSSLPNDISNFIIMVGANDNSGFTSAEFLLNIGKGSAGNEEFAAEDIQISIMGQEVINPNVFYVPEGLKEADRITAQLQCSINDANDRLLTISILGAIQ